MIRGRLRRLMADPTPLPADCGAIHPESANQAGYSRTKMAKFDRQPQHLRMVETIAGDPDLARYICRTTATEDRNELEEIARHMWEKAR